jgi:hypothetical protein
VNSAGRYYPSDGESEEPPREESVVSSPVHFAPAFMRAVAHDVLSYFEKSSMPVKWSARSRLAKFWCSNPETIHYEVWLHERRNLIELGLHFEADASLNSRLLGYFSGCLLEIQEELGDTIWVEEWDKGWTRLYEVRPMLPLNEERVVDTAARMCELIQVLQPYLDIFLADDDLSEV